MATGQQIRDLIAQTTSGSLRLGVPREVRDEVCRYATRRRRERAPWAVIAREIGLEVRKLQRWNARARRAASLPVLRPVEVVAKPDVKLRAYLRGATLRAVQNPGTATLARDVKSAESRGRSAINLPAAKKREWSRIYVYATSATVPFCPTEMK